MNELLTSLRAFSHRCSAGELANNVFKQYFRELDQGPEFPIDIFKMLRDFNINYIFQDLQDLEGIYSPDIEDSVAVVGINKNRRYERQRFTAAHELCHHLRDYQLPSVSPIDSKNDQIEVYANNFAAELLMPRRYFLQFARHYQDDKGFVSPDSALYLCNIFGTSFESVMWNLHKHRLLNFKLTKEFFSDFKVNEKIKELKLDSLENSFLKNIIDSYTYISRSDNSPSWLRLKNELIYNDGKIEGLNIDKQLAAEICTDIRLFGTKSSYFKAYHDNPAIVETAGQYMAYDKLMKENSHPDRYALKDYNKLLFSFAPHSELAGEYRKGNNAISGAIIQTTNYWEIEKEMFELEQDIKWYCNDIDSISFSNLIETATILHHRLTRIHPFEDGNGRTCRLLYNWVLKIKGLPPVYIEATDKKRYLEALTQADQDNLNPLMTLFMERTLHTLMFLNSECTLETYTLKDYI
ncbi:ImmA/IrrE family metallo-endopeptidase [Priestia flexa]|uniref:ImmA/IrrE family metallo-endopeptidase n=1 Tax=Priestia flexa TaxID=86664 RepID=UPI00240D15BC|nr:ImmA/IrrE family metallo-endopeptidase [Priestia flexa]WEZ09987.1 Fic family protein [Priestia flexa]